MFNFLFYLINVNQVAVYKQVNTFIYLLISRGSWSRPYHGIEIYCVDFLMHYFDGK